MWINENTPYKGSYLPRANHSCFVLATSENEDLKQESKTAFVLVVLCSYVCIHSTALVLLLFLVFKSETLGDILLKKLAKRRQKYLQNFVQFMLLFLLIHFVLSLAGRKHLISRQEDVQF